jgi:hypothetical protein
MKVIEATDARPNSCLNPYRVELVRSEESIAYKDGRQ